MATAPAATHLIHDRDCRSLRDEPSPKDREWKDVCHPWKCVSTSTGRARAGDSRCQLDSIHFRCVFIIPCHVKTSVQESSGSGLVLLIYDHLLTFSDEVSLVWAARPSLAKKLFLVNRYMVLASQLGIAYRSWRLFWSGVSEG